MELTMMASPARARHGSYIFQRPGSPNWYVQLRSPDGRKVVSLKTSDKLQAQLAASPMIDEHRAKLLAARPRFDTVWKHAMEPDASTRHRTAARSSPRMNSLSTSATTEAF